MTPRIGSGDGESNRPGQDDIDASKAPLMDHLIELRTRLIYSIAAFLVTFLGCFFVAKPIYNILLWPFVHVVGADKAKLIATHFLEQLFTNIKLAMFGAAFLSFPIVAAQIYKFVAPGLYKNERQAFVPYLMATPVFFVLGAMVVYFVVMPLLIRFSIDITPQAGRADERRAADLRRADRRHARGLAPDRAARSGRRREVGGAAGGGRNWLG